MHYTGRHRRWVRPGGNLSTRPPVLHPSPSVGPTLRGAGRRAWLGAQVAPALLVVVVMKERKKVGEEG